MGPPAVAPDVFVHLGPRDDLTASVIDEAAVAGARGARLFEAELLMAAARSGAATDVAERLSELAREIDGEFFGIRARNAAALATNDDDEFDAVQSAYRSLGYDGIADGLATARDTR